MLPILLVMLFLKIVHKSPKKILHESIVACNFFKEAHLVSLYILPFSGHFLVFQQSLLSLDNGEYNNQSLVVKKSQIFLKFILCPWKSFNYIKYTLRKQQQSSFQTVKSLK